MTEIRYRRLLALYPREFRQEYGDEMLGVLMADPRPGAAQAFDVVRGAIAAHLRLMVAGQSRVARTVQIFGAMLLFAVALGRVVVEARAALRYPEYVPPVDTVSWARLAGWGVALVAAYLGWRVAAAAGATVGLAGEIAAPARLYLDTPATVLHAYWLIVAAAVVLIAGLVAARGGRTEPRGLAWVAAASTLLVAEPVMFDRMFSPIGNVLVVAAAVLAAVAVIRQEPEFRARLLCWVAPVLVTIPLVQWGFGGLIKHNMGHPESLQLINPLQWAVLVLVPVAAFAGVSLLSRRDLPGLPTRR
ncbi:hypothetical protein Aab01nite_20940 [Paractinoplanes abujensis]|uniref:Uncharacterized protein n=1 Tax=Paractinoplanes abujensis TaxID=882441 RepID=A0A7W7CYJ3_9ACTN|nr:hypothetical protein [Actinoplanes abujensis]MBB4697022.1 hypothetical protein [Actinoplanes abujensis]GID18504.1 hypothetical protein Aab01nite_20940 [Actinoplanes abujensis]